MRIYLTHCSAKKDESLKGTGRKVTPDSLYIATPTQRFMRRCMEKEVHWAIFSDLYGVWFSDVRREWYEKDPNKVTSEEFGSLLKNFDKSLKEYDEIWFYYNPGRFHSLYKGLLEQSALRDRIWMFTHLSEIR
jgi:hypothetical protein